MATKLSKFFAGMAAIAMPTPHKSGSLCAVIISHTFTEDLGTGDILELAPLVPYGRIIGAEIATENLGALNLTLGLMTGTPGDTGSVRTSGSELFNAQSAAAPATATLLALAGIPKNGSGAVSLGLKTSVAIAAGPTKKVHVKLTYTS